MVENFPDQRSSEFFWRFPPGIKTFVNLRISISKLTVFITVFQILKYLEIFISGLYGMFDHLTPHFHGISNICQFPEKLFEPEQWRFETKLVVFISNVFLILHSEKYSKTASVNNRKLSRVD